MKLRHLFSFRILLFPWLIRLVFWLGSAWCIFAGILGLIHHNVLVGIFSIVFGPLGVRLLCEYSMVLFCINDTLTEIKNLLAVKAKLDD